MVEIRPNIFVRRTPEGMFEISALPEGSQIPGLVTPEEVVFRVGDLTRCTDPIETILWETCNQMFGKVPLHNPEFYKARHDYLRYTGHEWDSRQFYKRSV